MLRRTLLFTAAVLLAAPLAVALWLPQASGQGSPNTDPTIHPLDLTEAEKADLVAFLNALTDEQLLRDRRYAP